MMRAKNVAQILGRAPIGEVGETSSGDALRHAAGRLLRHAVEAEAQAFIDECLALKDERGRKRVVHNGYAVARAIKTCMGEYSIRVPRIRDLAGKLRFKSRILSPYQRRTEGQAERFSSAYLEGVSSGDFTEALSALIGPCALCLPAGTRTLLASQWRLERSCWPRDGLAGAPGDGLGGCWAGDALPASSKYGLAETMSVSTVEAQCLHATRRNRGDPQQCWLLMLRTLQARR